MPNYRKAGPDTHDAARGVMDRFHADLAQIPVTVEVLLAYNDGDGPTLKLGGFPVVARCKAVPMAERAVGCADIRIMLDEVAWRVASDETKLARLDRMLTHFTLAKDRDGNLRTDDLGRPKFKMRAPDWLISGFEVIADRHGEDSDEVAQAHALRDNYGNLLFAFADELAAAGA